MKIRLRYIASMMVFVLGIFILINATTVKLQAQCQSNISDVILAPIQQLSIGNIDFEHFESNVLLFIINLGNSPSGDSAQLHITLDISLAIGRYFPSALDFKSQNFFVPPAGAIITNLDIGKSILKEELSFDPDAKREVQDVALATGKFPAGKYIFRFSLEGCPIPPPERGVKIIEIINPSRVELRSPRDGEVTNEFPHFEFFSDCNKVELTVAEKSASQSREEAISHEPPMDRKDLIGQNSYLYSGGRPLEQGKTYVWKVVGKTLGPGGTEVEVPSPIGLFKVSRYEQTGQEEALLKILEEMFGSRYPSIFEQIHNSDFNLTGMNTLNGTVISRGDLLRLLNELRQINDNVELSFE